MPFGSLVEATGETRQIAFEFRWCSRIGAPCARQQVLCFLRPASQGQQQCLAVNQCSQRREAQNPFRQKNPIHKLPLLAHSLLQL
jgi:hypothetical protein